MLNNIYYLNIELNGYAWILLIILFVIYNFILIQFAPEIKKFIKDKINKKKPFRGLGK